MGRMWLEGMGEMSKDIDLLLQQHLQYNHYPPIHSDFVPVAKEAIERAQNEDYDHEIKMPNGKVLPVWKIINELHLDYFIEPEEEY